jgi:predicted GNAT family N-acyltransferase
MDDVHMQLACWERDRLNIEAIRFAVYMVERCDPSSLACDREDSRCRHVLASEGDGRFIGTGRLECDGRISRIVVLPEYRQQRLGNEILRYLAELAKELELPSVCVDADPRHLPFLQSLGFVETGAAPSRRGSPRYAMRLDLGDQAPKS